MMMMMMTMMMMMMIPYRAGERSGVDGEKGDDAHTHVHA
jgi:hypothetical protein